MSTCERRLLAETRARGGHGKIERGIAVERPCAVEVNGLGYAVLMVTPADLEDFGYGFCLSERLIDRVDDIEEIGAHETEQGTSLRMATRPALRERIFDRVRHRVTESSCGNCGIESLEQALRPIGRLPSRPDPVRRKACFRHWRGFVNTSL